MEFQAPVLNADSISSERLQELMGIKKPVALWGGMFALLEAKATSKDDEEGSGPYDAMWTDSAHKHEEAHGDIPPSDKLFVPKLESKFAEATTPAKLARSAGLKAPIRSPPLMVLKGMNSENSETDFRLAVSFNIEELHNAQIALRQKLFRSMTASQRQLEFVATITNKVIVLSGLMGVPDPIIEVPSVWQAVSVLKESLKSLVAHVGSIVHELKTTSATRINGPLLEAEIRDLRNTWNIWRR
ncbi:hypothetical protein ACA910_018519 [Epithemia clementina (nom. ined.)]